VEQRRQQGQVEGRIYVLSGVTLTIGKGVILFGLPNMTVNGTLLVEGTALEPVVFTGKKEEKPGEWCAINFGTGSGASVVEHAQVKYGGVCGGGEIVIENGVSPTIRKSTIAHSSGSAISIYSAGAPEISGNHIYANAGTAVRYEGTSSSTGEVNIHDNLVEGGIDGIEVDVPLTSSVAGANLGANTITGTSGKALSYRGPDIPGNITGNTLIANAQNVITIAEGKVATSSTWNNGGTWVKVEGRIYVLSGVTLKITKGVVLFRTPNMTVNGTLLVEGTASEPVVFTGAKREAPGEWCAIRLGTGSGASVIEYAEVNFGGACGGGEVQIENGVSPTIRNSTFARSSGWGITVASGSPHIESDRFRKNAAGLAYEGTGKLAAPNNDWGCADGPQPAGCGDLVTSNVEWKPAVHLRELDGPCRGKQSQCGEGADPVSLATGHLDYSHRDLFLTNKSAVPLEFTRTYDSDSAEDTGLGQGWSQSGLASVTELEGGTSVMVLRQDGRQDVFQKTEAGYKAPSGVTDTLEKVSGTFQLTTRRAPSTASTRAGASLRSPTTTGWKRPTATTPTGVSQRSPTPPPRRSPSPTTPPTTSPRS
jgi:Domain of unknown function (DUF6531)